MRVSLLSAVLVVSLVSVITGCGESASDVMSDAEIKTNLDKMVAELDEIASRLDQVSTADQEEAIFSELVRCVSRYTEMTFTVDDGPAIAFSVEVRERVSDRSFTFNIDGAESEVDVIVNVMSQKDAGEPVVLWERRIECLSKESIYVLMME